MLDPESAEMYANGLDVSYGLGKNPNYNSWCSLTMTGVQVAHVYDKDQTQDWAGYVERDPNSGEDFAVIGRSTLLHTEYPGGLVIESNGPGQHVIANHKTPNDGISRTYSHNTNLMSKGRLVELMRDALRGGMVTITDWFTKECLLVYQDLGGGKYGPPSGSEFFDDPVDSFLMALECIRLTGGMSTSAAIPKVKLRSGLTEKENPIRITANPALSRITPTIAIPEPVGREVVDPLGPIEEPDYVGALPPGDLYDLPEEL